MKNYVINMKIYKNIKLKIKTKSYKRETENQIIY